MPYKESYRSWITRVAGGQCQFEMYEERNGWQECGKRAEHVHHPIAERWQLEVDGTDPEHEVHGVPLCHEHHIGNGKDATADEHSSDFAFHPDTQEAHKRYKAFKEHRSELIYHYGWKGARMVKSPYVEMAEEHQRKTEQGERYWAGTPEIDRYYAEKMERKAVIYSLEHPEDPEPERKPHPRFKPKKRWFDDLFD